LLTHLHLPLPISLSNIALKMNTKLSNSINKAKAWQIGDYRGSRGMPSWVTDETMIMGIALSRGEL